jgi:hypothetical protein
MMAIGVARKLNTIQRRQAGMSAPAPVRAVARAASSSDLNSRDSSGLIKMHF